jgi:signal transduction histidine kinase
VIHQAIELVRPKIEERKHQLRPLMPAAPIYLEADAQRLGQVFVNLLENAAKYTPHGGTIWIKASTEGGEAVVRVQDTGIGITPQVMPHIFDLFSQGEISFRSESGLGIGLSVVKDIVSLHGGSVQATSDGLGKGSEFTVRLPLPGQAGLPGMDRPVRAG